MLTSASSVVTLGVTLLSTSIAVGQGPCGASASGAASGERPSVDLAVSCFHPSRVASQSIPASSAGWAMSSWPDPLGAADQCRREPHLDRWHTGQSPDHRFRRQAQHCGGLGAPVGGGRLDDPEEGPRPGLFGWHLHPPRERNARGGPGVERSRAAGAFPDRAPSPQSRSRPLPAECRREADHVPRHFPRRPVGGFPGCAALPRIAGHRLPAPAAGAVFRPHLQVHPVAARAFAHVSRAAEALRARDCLARGRCSSLDSASRRGTEPGLAVTGVGDPELTVAMCGQCSYSVCRRSDGRNERAAARRQMLSNAMLR